MAPTKPKLLGLPLSRAAIAAFEAMRDPIPFQCRERQTLRFITRFDLKFFERETALTCPQVIRQIVRAEIDQGRRAEKWVRML